jgi:threonine/homoserine/homoserine lactone efflux protein
MAQDSLAVFAVLSLAVVAVPGPSVLFAVGRALAEGRRVALLTVLGNTAGLSIQVLVVAVGAGLLLAGSDALLALLRPLGAAYLVWLGLAAIRRRPLTTGRAGPPVMSTFRPLRDGLVVGLANPKSMLFLAALLPPFVRPEVGPVVPQVLLLGLLFCAIALVGDGAWAVAAAYARDSLASDPRRLAWCSVAGGSLMVGLGLVIAVG